MKWKTKFTIMTGCEYPIIQGAYATFGTHKIAAPVSEAGGMGVITAIAFRKPEKLREDIKKCKKLTEKPFGVNFSILKQRGYNEDFFDEMVNIVIDEDIKTVFTSAYKAMKIGQTVKEHGINWFHKVATMKHALAAERQGADGVTIVGLEGTGYKNPIQNTTLINMTNAVRLLKIPVIAAGGIGDARGYLSALTMGAQAVCMGTAFMACKECPIPDKFKKNKLVEQSAFDPNLHPKVFHLELRDSMVPSMAVGVIDKIMTVKEFIDQLINESEAILKKMGVKGEIIDFT
ncbi:MAG: NAD(P)H-dependent flavin oxidoreductase [Candidatus Helarchaeota archaeon]